MNELEALTQAISELPSECQQHLSAVVKGLKEDQQRRTQVLKLVQIALGQLRLDMKYLVFDLESTRLERDEYKTQLERK